MTSVGFPHGLQASLVAPDGKGICCRVGDQGLTPKLERFPGEREATHSKFLPGILWTERPERATIHVVAEDRT